MTSQEQPLILMTCDDGVESPGLRAAVSAMLDLGKVMISAPCEQQSGAGRGLSPLNDGAIHEIDYPVNGLQVPAYAIHGSPAQSVLYAMVELVPRKPALCVSGINFGENVGSIVTRSGTVGAAMEAASEGVPALAVSLQTEKEFHYNHSDKVDFGVAAHFARFFAQRLLDQPMPADVDLLKVDIPCNATVQTPWQVTRLSRQRYYHSLPSGRRYLSEKRRLGYDLGFDQATLELDSDIHALVVDRVVTVTPLSLDMTSRVPLDDLAELLN